MRHNKLFLLALVLSIFATSIIAGNNPAARENAERNYLEGIKSENTGLKVSSAYFLGELESKKAVIPLMKILREDDCDGARLAAALALVKIGDGRGVYLVKKSIDFNECEKVRKLAKHLYSAYLSNGAELAELDVEYASLALK